MKGCGTKTYKGRCVKDVASKPLMLETLHASNSWAHGPGPLGPSLGPGPRGGEVQVGGCPAVGLPFRAVRQQPPRLRLAAGPRLGPKGPWARAHELEACGVSSIRGFEATSFRQGPLGLAMTLRRLCDDLDDFWRTQRLP